MLKAGTCGNALSRVLVVLLGCTLGWSVLAAEYAPARIGQPIELTEAERQWIAENPVLKLGVDPAWPPFSSINAKGQFEGLDAEILAIVTERLGLKLELVPTASWVETEELLEKGEIDLAPSVSWTEERDGRMRLSDPYVSYPVAVVMRDDTALWTELGRLRGMTVAAPRDYVTTQMLEREFPDIRLLYVENPEEALRAVADRRADATLESYVAAIRAIRGAKLENLRIVGITPYSFALRLATPRDRGVLMAILNKGLASLAEAEIFEIEDRWIPLATEPSVNWPAIIRVALAALAAVLGVIVVIVLWNRRLAAELAERRRVETELHQANTMLRELNEEKEMFMHMAAHDLNGPLTTIAMGCEVIAMTVPKGRTEAHEGIAHIRTGVRRMRDLIGRFLSSEAIRHGFRNLRLEPLELSRIATEVVARHGRAAHAKGVRIDLRFSADDPSDTEFHVRGDATAMDQVLDNLLSNAVKFSPKGSEVGVELSKVGGKVRLTVLDRGPGVSPEEMPRLFTKFARLSARPTGGEESTGLGLAIVKNLVDAQLGSIRCESRQGTETRFVVEFPAIPSSERNSADAP